MPFVKDTSYRDIPFSPESPCTDDFHYFVSVKQLIEEIKCHRDMLRCRTVGTVSSDYGKFVIHESIPVSVAVRLRETMKWVNQNHAASPADAKMQDE
ncbi:uncharacterized protein isoform X2 [Choristoneura fumiferana]|uniref:uncharacterized protein isoform X2 n=1 Tax=Choristoneura fumiferana TaxID=7141 RepID=UPI003D15855C